MPGLTLSGFAASTSPFLRGIGQNQALFGLERHPMVGETPLLLKLTSPAGRPIQATRDLPGFWRGSWRDVAKDMKGRYPRHRWPEEPWTEAPSTA